MSRLHQPPNTGEKNIRVQRLASYRGPGKYFVFSVRPKGPHPVSKGHALGARTKPLEYGQN